MVKLLERYGGNLMYITKWEIANLERLHVVWNQLYTFYKPQIYGKFLLKDHEPQRLGGRGKRKNKHNTEDFRAVK